MRSIASDGPARRGLTITEILAVIGIIIVLLAILLLLLGAFREKDTLNKQRNEEIPKPAVARNADSPSDQEAFSKDPESGYFPA